jgi:hypothetical protein
MGSLKPGATYIYEHVDGVTYAREFGAVSADRFEIGRTLERQTKDFGIEEAKLWGDIRRAAKTNKALQTAIDNVIIMYHLSKDNGKK